MRSRVGREESKISLFGRGDGYDPGNDRAVQRQAHSPCGTGWDHYRSEGSHPQLRTWFWREFAQIEAS